MVKTNKKLLIGIGILIVAVVLISGCVNEKKSRSQFGVEKLMIYENGKSHNFLGSKINETLVEELFTTLKRANQRSMNVFTEDEINEIKENLAVELILEKEQNIKTGYLESLKVKTILFILDGEYKGHVLTRSHTGEWENYWIEQKGTSGQMDKGWTNEVKTIIDKVYVKKQITKEQAIAIANATEEAQEFLKLYPDAILEVNGPIGNDCEGCPQYWVLAYSSAEQKPDDSITIDINTTKNATRSDVFEIANNTKEAREFLAKYPDAHIKTAGPKCLQDEDLCFWDIFYVKEYSKPETLVAMVDIETGEVYFPRG